MTTYSSGGWSAVSRMITSPDALMVTAQESLAKEFMERWGTIAELPHPGLSWESLEEFLHEHVLKWKRLTDEVRALTALAAEDKTSNTSFYDERLQQLDKSLGYYSD